MDSREFNVEVAKDMIKECEKHLAKIEYNDRFSASNIDEAISNCMDELKDIVCTYGK